MIQRSLRAMLGAAVLFWAVQDLTGNTTLASIAALLPLGLGIPNIMPFTVVALPVIAATAAVAARLWPELGFDSAAVLHENAEQVRGILSAQLRN